MRNKTIVLVCLILAALAVDGQNSGYQGKKFSLNYSTYFVNALRFPNQFGNKGLLAFNAMHHLNADVVVGRRKTLGLSFEYARTSFDFGNHLEYQTEDIYGYYSQRLVYRTDDVGRIDMYTCGIYMRHFFKGNIAPLGTYIKPGLNIIIYSVDPGDPVSKKGLTLEDAGIDLINDSPYFAYNITIEVGQNRIFSNRMFLDYGLRLGVSPHAASYAGNEVEHSRFGFLQDVSHRRLDSMLLLNAKIGVGILL